MRARPAIAILLALAASGCGYRLLGVPDGLGSDIQIGMLQNSSDMPGVERVLTDALHEEFTRRGQLTPRYSGASSLVLRGRVREVNLRHTAFSSVGLALEDQLELVVDIQVTRSSDGQILWRRDGWSEAERFTSSADPQTYLKNKEQAVLRLSSELASRIHDELFVAF